MSKSSKIIIAVLVIAALILGIALLMGGGDDDTTPATQQNGQNSSGQTMNGQPQPPANEQQPEEPEAIDATINYTDSGFDPAHITVAAGSTIEIVNESGAALEFASDPHPTHTDNMELNVGLIAAGSSATFVVNQAGTWGYHNHLNASQTGEITVQ